MSRSHIERGTMRGSQVLAQHQKESGVPRAAVEGRLGSKDGTMEGDRSARDGSGMCHCVKRGVH